MLDRLRLQPRRELGGRVVVVLDRVSRARHPRPLETRDRVQKLELNGHGQGSGQPVDVELVGVEPFRLEEDLMPLRVGELDDLVFDRRAVARTARGDRAAVQRRLLEVAANDVLHRFTGPRDPAR